MSSLILPGPTLVEGIAHLLAEREADECEVQS